MIGELSEFLTALAAIVIAGLGVWNAIRIHSVEKTVNSVGKTVKSVQVHTNGMMADIKFLATKAGHAAGLVEGVAGEKAAQKARDDVIDTEGDGSP